MQKKKNGNGKHKISGHPSLAGSSVSSPQPNGSGIMDVDGLAAYLAVSVSWIYKSFESGFLPGIKLTGGLLRFRQTTIDKWLAKRETSGRSARRLEIDLEPDRPLD